MMNLFWHKLACVLKNNGWANGSWNSTQKQSKSKPVRAQWNALVTTSVSMTHDTDVWLEAKQIQLAPMFQGKIWRKNVLQGIVNTSPDNQCSTVPCPLYSDPKQCKKMVFFYAKPSTTN